MDIGLFVPPVPPAVTAAVLARLGTGAEERGFRSVWVPEHVVGRRATTLDPFASLTWMAAATTTLRLGTGVALISQREPFFTAKQVASLDYLSGGRVDFGVGVGWVKEEFEALGMRRAERGPRADRNLEAMRALWVEPGYQPTPVQRPHPPIHVGGHSDAALRRVARFGQGWYAFNLDADEFAARLAALSAVLADHGRSRAELTVSVCPFLRPADGDLLERYRAAGADQVVVMMPVTAEHEMLTALDRLAGLARA